MSFLTLLSHFIEYDRAKSEDMAKRILFGMIVRERRRIAALAKVASALDDRVQAADRALIVRDAALRSSLEDHRQDVADLEHQQHDQIISLLDMVSESAGNQDIESEGDLQSVAMFQKKLLVLANERVALYVRPKPDCFTLTLFHLTAFISR